ncbi:MAG: 16S rRNA (cytosine(1402)-N(4))-methyltransferase RsmH [Candidatus Saccharicenans sp.]|nr:16S rRNA (cytosine(1402)-N(4))-methyltransferase RsmH [Candidatus Saccharicenans sp.]MDI6849284.1 16S rRNA (cytosine(1402)-N(4))-methyltransferase RsmH [Candidatus Saccharicenans sp.]
MKDFGHRPVLVEETLAYLQASRPGLYIDCTIGLGGHALEILRRNPGARIIGFDLDELSLKAAADRLADYRDRVKLFQLDFRQMLDFPDLIPFQEVKGVLADLGISSFQLDNPERGFSFNLEGPLDMRMDTRQKTTAEKILMTYPETRLAEVFKKYGELHHTRLLARKIASQRKLGLLKNTTDLKKLVEEVYRWVPQKNRLHPAARVFQALRIEVNQELKGLDAFLDRLAGKCQPGTRLVVISFHSLEDRLVKKAFQRLVSTDRGQPLVKVLTRKPVRPSPEEIEANSRSHSAKLRAAERI